jgi:hypothetical protein
VNAAAAQLALPLESDTAPRMPPDVARYLRSTDAPELCECQRPVADCECRRLFAEAV